MQVAEKPGWRSSMQWGLNCANYITVPGFHGFEDAQAGWVASQKLTDASCRERYGWERRKRVVFRLWTELGQVFFGFQDGEVVRVVYGCSKRPRKKEPGPRISSDWRPTWSAALSDRHEVSHQKTSVCGAFLFLRRLTNTLKFPVEFNKKIKNKGSLRQRADPLPSTPPTFSLWPYRTSVLHAIESLFKFSDWPNLPGKAKCGRWWRRERMGICTWIWQCSHACTLSGKNWKCEESNECASKEQWIGAESLLSWASPFELAASGGFCATTYSWLKSRSSYRRWFLNCETCDGSEKKKANRKWKETGFSAGEWLKCSRQFACQPEPFAHFLFWSSIKRAWSLCYIRLCSWLTDVDTSIILNAGSCKAAFCCDKAAPKKISCFPSPRWRR